MITVLDQPVRDPHCARSSDAYLTFEVAGSIWHVRWGRFDTFGSAAYWVDQTIRFGYEQRVPAKLHGPADLESEVVFCLLGGFGVRAEDAAEAHARVMPTIATSRVVDAGSIEVLLRGRSAGGEGNSHRFPHQRAQRIAAAVQGMRNEPVPREPLSLRDRLLKLPGIGPKTAAWIVRNYAGSDEVAIIDIWLVRMLTWNGVFQRTWDVRRNYGFYETAFLSYAQQGNVRPAALDLCIWDQARRLGKGALPEAPDTVT